MKKHLTIALLAVTCLVQSAAADFTLKLQGDAKALKYHLEKDWEIEVDEKASTITFTSKFKVVYLGMISRVRPLPKLYRTTIAEELEDEGELTEHKVVLTFSKALSKDDLKQLIQKRVQLLYNPPENLLSPNDKGAPLLARELKKATIPRFINYNSDSPYMIHQSSPHKVGATWVKIMPYSAMDKIGSLQAMIDHHYRGQRVLGGNW